MVDQACLKPALYSPAMVFAKGSSLSHNVDVNIVFMTTNKCSFSITTVSFYIIYTPICFNISVILREFYICALPCYINSLN